MKRSRTLLIGVPLVILLLGVSVYKYGFVRIKSELSAIKEDEAVKTKLLDKYLALIAEKPRLEKHLASLKEERLSDNSKLVEGQTPSLAAATLQETIKGIVIGRGGTISSERVGKPEDLGKFRVISISIDTVLPDSRALSDILYSIETRTPFLVIKDLDARVRNFKEPKELTVKLDVMALTAGK
ncbi:MAG: hypothetical protein HZB33_12005 [Nitrospirae bacterium]|nr:hypothetical protein [Nitrospirota bacterium]